MTKICTRDNWNVNTHQFGQGGPVTLRVFKHRRGPLIQYGDHNGREFSTHDEATSFALARGYLQPYNRTIGRAARRKLLGLG